MFFTFTTDKTYPVEDWGLVFQLEAMLYGFLQEFARSFKLGVRVDLESEVREFLLKTLESEVGREKVSDFLRDNLAEIETFLQQTDIPDNSDSDEFWLRQMSPERIRECATASAEFREALQKLARCGQGDD